MANAQKLLFFTYSGLIRMANAIKPMCVFVAYSAFIRIANAIKPFEFSLFGPYPDGKRNKTNVFFLIRMANVIKPMICLNIPLIPPAYSDGKRIKTNTFLRIQMANVIKPMLFNKTKYAAYSARLFRWQTQ